ncbi:MAG: SDR family oxidoreductase [Acidimicrobiia bacterium]|nr:SDR family oxidoreductase [Acidimicrobiia bacterium]
MSETAKRVALVGDASFYVGPSLARELARREHNLVLGDPAEGLVDELTALGVEVEAVLGVRNLADPESAQKLVAAAQARFGRIDSAAAFSGRVVTGKFLDSTLEDLHSVVQGCLEAPYHFLKAVVPVMVEQGDGQVLVMTSATAARPSRNASLYSSARAGATMMVKNVAAEVARNGVQVNAVGTNFMDFPEFLRASGANDPEIRARIEAAVPLGRLGTVEEFASFCMPFIDGTSKFTTGQFIAYAGGWA